MRTLIADGIVAIAGCLLRWVDPHAHELHLVRTRTPLGAHIPLLALDNPCDPPLYAYEHTGLDWELLRSHR